MAATQSGYERSTLSDYSDEISAEEARDEWIECRIAEIADAIRAALKSGTPVKSRMGAYEQTAVDELAEYSSSVDHWIKQAILGKPITELLIDAYTREHAEIDYYGYLERGLA